MCNNFSIVSAVWEKRRGHHFALKSWIRMLTPVEIFHVRSDGVKTQGKRDKEQGYNHQFVSTVRGL